MPKRDYYDILGVSKSASADDIKKAHRKLVRQHHPDVNKNNPKSTELFKEAQEAYDVLSDPEKRRQYDQFGHYDPRMGPPPGAADPFEGFRRQGAGPNNRGWRAQGGAGQQVDPRDFGMGGGADPGDFASIFEQMFGGAAGTGGAQPQGRAGGRRGGGGGAGGGRAPEPQKGQDLDHVVQLTFEQAAHGTTLPLRMQIGSPPNSRTETLEVKIPQGIADGSKIRVKGKGHPSPTGRGENGDLYITAKVAPHPLYRREGLDVHTEVPVSLYDALLGAKITVPTLAGEVTLTLPPGTSSGAKLRIKGRGITRGAGPGETGDAYAILKILLPKDLPEEAKALIEQLKTIAPIKP